MWSLDEKLEPVAVQKIGSNTKTHNKHAYFLAFKGYQIFQERLKKGMENESSCTKTQMLIETLAEKFFTVASGAYPAARSFGEQKV